MIDDIINDAEARMNKSLQALQQDLAKIRTGRAHPDLLAQVTVEYYGMPTPLQQLASISVIDARTLSVSPFEKSMVNAVDKAIMSAGLGLNPVNLGDVLRVPLPPLTEESRKDLVKLVKSETEKGRIAVRNVRRDANSMIKDLVKDKEISEDDGKRAEERIQKLTDSTIASMDAHAAEKEKELMAV